MENFIIVLISIVFVIYNIYKNFKKEMEKSKSRQPNVRPKTAPTIDTSTWDNSKNTPEIKTKNIEPAYTPELPYEVRAAQERRRQSQIQNPLAAKQLKEEEETERNVYEFDLRQAVIQSVILERPYK